MGLFGLPLLPPSSRSPQPVGPAAGRFSCLAEPRFASDWTLLHSIACAAVSEQIESKSGFVDQCSAYYVLGICDIVNTVEACSREVEGEEAVDAPPPSATKRRDYTVLCTQLG